MAPGRLRIFHPVLLGHSVLAGVKGVYLPADQDFLQGGGHSGGQGEQGGERAVRVRHCRDDHGLPERHQGGEP